MFKKVLVANRGEIALRVVRACRELGVRSVVAHSTADRESMATRLADEAVCIGPPPGRRSYLNAAAVVEAARLSGAEAIHPGYGFLSEDADFAEICADHGLVMIGPRPEVMAALADKADARRLMAAAGLPLLPGSDGTVSTLAQATAVADRIGYPVIVKTSAGGGGRGMAVVHAPAELAPAYHRIRLEARNLFGDDRIYLERYLTHARHVEVQVLCDGHGAGVHLGTRDCSVQRRQQKLIEEAPAPVLDADTLEAICADALRGVLRAGYSGVGTLEFLVDEAGRHYFMEINCRIQVEHPVTEMITGIDLVHEQLHVACGTPLRLRQSDVRPHGVAVECRINAEDPARDFVPTPGRLATFQPPGGPFTRVDTHAHAGYRITPYYDPLLAKVIVWAPERELALDRMHRALDEFQVTGSGVHTTIPFLRRVLDDPRFRRGRYTTGLVGSLLPGTPPPGTRPAGASPPPGTTPAARATPAPRTAPVPLTTPTESPAVPGEPAAGHRIDTEWRSA